MFKKIICIFLVIVLCLSVLVGCDSRMSFETEGEMQSYVDGAWACGETIYAVSNGKIMNFSMAKVEYIWSEFCENPKNDFSQYTSQKFYEDVYLSETSILIFNCEYNYKESKVTSGTAEWLEFLDDGTAIRDEKDIFEKISSSPTYVEDKVKEFFDENKEDLRLKIEHPNLASAREVQYDKWGHFGRKFLITGTAQLDDYYNYDYRDYEYGYFCINIRPSGGKYSDEWYVYANRNQFDELYKSLQNGSKNVTLVAQMIFVDTGSNNMATLVDYKK